MNGVEMDRTLAKNGKDLTPVETKKEDDKVMKRTVKYSDPATAKKETDKQNKQIEEVMSAMQLRNGHREQVNGRSVLFYDIVPNPNFKAKNLNQRFAQVMQGKISVDEDSSEPIDINIKAHGPGGRFGGRARGAVFPSLFPVQRDDRCVPSVFGDGAAGGFGEGSEVGIS